jgi:F-type H+-transporting ATPase subunit b
MSARAATRRRRLDLFLLAWLLAVPAVGLAAYVVPAPVEAQQEETVQEAEHEAEPVEAPVSELIFRWINFFVVFGVGGYFLAGPLRRWAAGQRRSIQEQIAEARREREKAQKELEEIERRLEGLEQEIAALRREASDNAAAETQRVHQAAEREGARILATTGAEIDSASRAARLELRAYAARLAVALAEQRIQQQLSPQAHATLFEASLRELAAGTEGRQ